MEPMRTRSVMDGQPAVADASAMDGQPAVADASPAESSLSASGVRRDFLDSIALGSNPYSCTSCGHVFLSGELQHWYAPSVHRVKRWMDGWRDGCYHQLSDLRVYSRTYSQPGFQPWISRCSRCREQRLLDQRRFDRLVSNQASIQRPLEADAQRSTAVAATSGRPLDVIGEEDTV